MAFNKILLNVEKYYTQKIDTFGVTPKGVDWNSLESQEMRFKQLLKILKNTNNFTINDFGCGYGALVDFMNREGYSFQYYGFDISEQMIQKAKETHIKLDNCFFYNDESSLKFADYSVASGIFNVKLQTNEEDWKKYILYTLNKITNLSRKGFSFNMLTKYSDIEHMRHDLYYGDPLFFFDYCKKNFSRFVSLLHDYPLYEFTILVTIL